MTTLGRLWRHQAASLFATVIDFGTMIALVTWCAVSPPAATLVGASLGATANFSVNRRWTFRREGPVLHQGLRYALVSAASAGLNALGEHFAVTAFRAPYVAARVAVALLVGVLWNFPAQHLFVFRPPRSATQ